MLALGFSSGWPGHCQSEEIFKSMYIFYINSTLLFVSLVGFEMVDAFLLFDFLFSVAV
jgi:hypothetical protein